MLRHMRTTVRLNERLLAEAKKYAAQSGKTLTAVLEDANVAEALTFAEQLRGQPNCVLVSPGTRHWEIFQRLCAEIDARGNMVPDAYLAALAIESGCEWISTDRDFSRFKGLRWRHPLQ